MDLNDSEDGTEVYSCHSFRTFADSQMAKCGLDRKFIALILSHKSKLAAEASYVDWTEIERQWVEKCEQNMTWFRPTEVIKEVVDPVARKLLADLLNIIGAQRTVGKGQKGSTKLLEERVQKFLESIEDKERSRIRSE